MVNLDELTIDASRLWPGETLWDGPMAFIDLDATRNVPESLTLPPCPVLGLGDPRHPLASSLDAVIEAPVTARAIIAQVLRAPNAAAIVVQLLRLLPSLSIAEGLTAESIAYALLQGSAEHAGWIAGYKGRLANERTPGNVATAREGDRMIVTLNHPDSGNAIDRHMRDQLHDALALASLDKGISRISLRGLGRTFSLGAELCEFGTTTDPATAHAIRCRTLPARAALGCIDRLEAHIQGGCVGSGLELAAYARRITAAPDAWFQLPELAMGILPGAGGCVSLTRRIGRQRTALMSLSGKRLSVRRALAWGLVDAIVDEAP